MWNNGLLCLLVLASFTAVVYTENMTCRGDVSCPGDSERDGNGNTRDQCCSRYFAFLEGCCSNEENGAFRVIRDIVIGVSVGIAGLIAILLCICICCCCCVCCN